ncbi:aldo/keto reductase [Microbacterium aurum]|uniref:Aldo/keto reductase n=1 Tax=Microbacterium aurum TaxID=36805 RepID=A0A1P8U717_9MICO|nr:aldo/keto reductase [Microbacterium aurum]APZ33917.1 aldo/keto reductase [Microbacterium aurum]MBM7827678.1 aryl-alcohol dehydrogenase-like predicted oxidoreductase [Microbacterium aurum]
MKYTALGDLRVSRLGLGCMGMSHLYTGHSIDNASAVRTLHRALDLGVTHLDTAELYGPLSNETLLGSALHGRRDDVVLATKFGLRSHTGKKAPVDSSELSIRIAVEGSLRRLQTDRIDLYYQHRVDPDVPIEDVMGTLSALVDEGKIRHVGLSEAGKGTIRRAHAVHPVAAVQSEYSLWSRDADDGTLDVLSELGIGFVPYSPLNRGLLTGKIRSLDPLDADDWRRTNPRFLPGALERNLETLREVTVVADEVSATEAQVALAWLLARDPSWSPIPGTTRIDHLEEDLGALDIVLSDAQMQRLTDIAPAVGGHHTEAQMQLFDR